jgi:hypothetical protein
MSSTTSFSPSVNIIRDKDKEINYIRTINGQLAFEHIVESVKTSVRSFSIIGAYGSGKSTFLWALEKAVTNKGSYFDYFDYFIKGYAKYDTIDLIGEFASLETCFAKLLQCASDKVLDALKQYADRLKDQKTGLIIRIDEFGKFLEYAAKNNPEKDFYFLQQLTEYINNDKGNVILITTLHQDFSGYAIQLTESQRNEWVKVKGRFKEIAFNVPAEQLLHIAAQRMSSFDTMKVDKQKVDALWKVVNKAKAFPLTDFFTEEIGNKLYPLELMAASVLSLALQRYGQNDRSLFTFLDSEDFKGIRSFINQDQEGLYDLVEVCDYLVYHYYTIITAQRNPDYRIWKLIQDSTQRAEGLFDGEELVHALTVIKIIGLLQLFSRKSMVIDDTFISTYLKITKDIEVNAVLRKLKSFGIVRFRSKQHRYILFEGTDIDIEEAIAEARSEVSSDTHIGMIDKYFRFPVLLAKKHFIETGNPRFFEFQISTSPLDRGPKGDVDGIINLVFGDPNIEPFITTISERQQDAVVYIYYKNTKNILDQINYIQQIQVARKKYEGDRVAHKEFNALYDIASVELKQIVMDSLHRMDSSLLGIYYGGQEVGAQIPTWKSFIAFLSDVVSRVYHSSPEYRNEMVNKSKISSQIASARRLLLTRLIEQESIEDLGYDKDLFPPDKTIYLSLIKQNGFHQQIGGEWQLTAPTNDTFQVIWQEFLNFIESSKQSKRTLQEFVTIISSRPFKLKKGLQDFILPLFLLIKRDSFALFYEGTRFIPQITVETIDLILRKPEQYSIKAFHVEGMRLEVFNQYRELLNQATTTTLSKKSFIDTIIPFLTFFKDLPTYAKQTKSISKDAQRLRESITKATDPEKSFFEDFPQALGFSLSALNESPEKMQSYFESLRTCIKEIQLSYDALLDRFENYIQFDLLGYKDQQDFDTWRSVLQKRFTKAKKDLLPASLKTFLLRLNSPLDDKKAWLNSIAQVLLGKSLELIQDFEEDTLHRKLKDSIEELDNYTDILANTTDDDAMHTFKVQVTHLRSGTQSRIVKINQQNLKSVAQKQELLKKELSEDKNLNIFILTQLLEEQLKK